MRGRRSSMCLVGSIISAVVQLAGCAHYEPRPIHARETAEMLASRRLTDRAVLLHIQSVTGNGVEDGEPKAPKTWGRAELLLAALDLNPPLAEARASLELSRAGMKIARALQNPTISLASEYDLARAAEPTWLWGMGSSFLIHTFVGRQLRVDLSNATIRGAEADFHDAVWTVRRDVRAALLTLVIAKRRVALLEEDVQQRADLARLASQRVAAGESARADALQADLELSRSRAAREEAGQGLVDARAKLAVAIGISVAALEGIDFAWDDLEHPSPVPQSSLTKLREQALLSRSDLERALAEYDLKELELKQQMGAQYLQASIGPGYTWDHGVRKATFNASAALPIFNRNEGPIGEALAAREVAARHAVAVQAQILGEIDTAVSAYESALAALDRARIQRRASDELAAAASRALDAGESDRPTELAALASVTTEQLAELNALDRAQQALGQLEDTLRTPLSGPETQLK